MSKCRVGGPAVHAADVKHAFQMSLAVLMSKINKWINKNKKDMIGFPHDYNGRNPVLFSEPTENKLHYCYK